MNIVIALAPVVAFLVLLQLMDSFRLVTIRAVLTTIAGGAVIAILWMPLHTWFLTTVDVDLKSFTRYIAPLTEEFCSWERSREGACAVKDINRSAFVAWIDCAI